MISQLCQDLDDFKKAILRFANTPHLKFIDPYLNQAPGLCLQRFKHNIVNFKCQDKKHYPEKEATGYAQFLELHASLQALNEMLFELQNYGCLQVPNQALKHARYISFQDLLDLARKLRRACRKAAHHEELFIGFLGDVIELIEIEKGPNYYSAHVQAMARRVEALENEPVENLQPARIWLTHAQAALRKLKPSLIIALRRALCIGLERDNIDIARITRNERLKQPIPLPQSWQFLLSVYQELLPYLLQTIVEDPLEKRHFPKALQRLQSAHCRQQLVQAADEYNQLFLNSLKLDTIAAQINAKPLYGRVTRILYINQNLNARHALFGVDDELDMHTWFKSPRRTPSSVPLYQFFSHRRFLNQDKLPSSDHNPSERGGWPGVTNRKHFELPLKHLSADIEEISALDANILRTFTNVVIEACFKEPHHRAMGYISFYGHHSVHRIAWRTYPTHFGPTSWYCRDLSFGEFKCDSKQVAQLWFYHYCHFRLKGFVFDPVPSLSFSRAEVGYFEADHTLRLKAERANTLDILSPAARVRSRDTGGPSVRGSDETLSALDRQIVSSSTGVSSKPMTYKQPSLP